MTKTKTIPSEPHQVSEPMNELEYYRALQQAQGQLAEAKKDLQTRDDQLTEARRQTRDVEKKYEELGHMHSLLSNLNVERQATIADLETKIQERNKAIREAAREALRQGRPDDLREGLRKILTLCWGPE